MVETFDLKSSKDHAFNKFHFQMKICVKIIDAKKYTSMDKIIYKLRQL